MELKQKHKDYLKEKGITSITDLTWHLETIKKDGGNRQMLFDFVWFIVNKEDSLRSFFYEVKNDLPKTTAEIVNVILAENDEDLKKILNESYMFLDEVLDPGPNEIVHHKFGLFRLEKRVSNGLIGESSSVKPCCELIEIYDSLKEAKKAQKELTVGSIILPSY